ncbi:hypothetical protein WR25_06244 [Diploscapter pachys]|uniref:Alpha-mannosidase n=1 Tax=Diploscapter pachys TaxID=2018661 RepID=A0A2A2LXT3_9BILA|nr:hypothetical protein WR25_06244 [Diploscapter pachys]
MLYVHFIPHSHDDMGWKKTVDQYFYGSHNTENQAGVQYIYDGVIAELVIDPSKRFSFCETGFLWRWWTSRSPQRQDQFRKLIQNGQLEIIGGGWTQSDEAAAHYVDFIDQMTLGLRTLSDNFGECGKPQASWQIDPFGHSREIASLFSQMGFTSTTFARQHYLEKIARQNNKSMEMIWNASDDLKTSLFTGALYNHYVAPDGFCFDIRCATVDPFIDNPNMPGNNVDQKIDAFLKKVYEQKKITRTNHMMMLMGDDFNYMQASMWFTNLDKLIQYTNARKVNVTVFYSTPACYYKAIQDAALQQKITWPTKDDDFFPYASNVHAYWAGYFASRPAFKGMIRVASGLLQLSKSLMVMGNLAGDNLNALQIAKMASALVQHHDAVTGTSKQDVTYDYQQRLHKGMSQAQTLISNYLGRVQSGPNATNPGSVPVSLCYLANETVCEAIVNVASFQITVFNTRAQWANETIRIPYYSSRANVKGPNGIAVTKDLLRSFNITTMSSSNYALYELHIAVQIPPLGFTTYTIDNSTSSPETEPEKPVTSVDATSVVMENQYFKLIFDENYVLTQYFDKVANKMHSLTQQFFYYIGMDCRGSRDNNTLQASGAYAFRPNGPEVPIGKPTAHAFVNGTLVQEMRQQYGDWIYQTIRLRSDANYVEFDWVIGPVPTGAQVSKEVITRYISDVANNDIFYTDSTGRQMMKRRRNFAATYQYSNDEPVAGNYYPLTNRIYINDATTQMTVLTDRAESGTARNSTIEILLHRRLFYDDNFGVDEVLNEPGKDGKGLVVRGSHYLVLGDVKKAASTHRPLAVKVFHKPVVAFTKSGTNMQKLGQARN